MKRTSRSAYGTLPAAIVLFAGASVPALCREREPQPESVRVDVHAAHKGCTVDLDSTPVGQTDTNGDLVLTNVEPGDHYMHVQCSGGPVQAYFISPRAGENLKLRPGDEQPAPPPLAPAEVRVRLREHIREAIQLRARGRVDEAVEQLRKALQLDPENSDLHREMGITFLIGKEWKRARVEMLEAVRHDPADAEAHNSLGYALEKLGDLAGALREYRTAAHLEPTDYSYRRRYIDALAKLSAKQAEEKK